MVLRPASLVSFLLLFCCWLGSAPFHGAAGQPPAKLRRVTLAPQMSAMLPADFQVMPDDAIATKYPAPRKPVAAYTSPSGQIDFVVSQKSTPFKAGDLAILLRFYKSNILNIYSNNVQFTQEKMVNLNGTDFIALEFTSALAGTAADAPGKSGRGAVRRYSYLLYTILPPKSEKDVSQLLSFTFACPAVLADTWKPVAQQIVASVKVK